MNTAQIITEKKNDYPILIVDKLGVIGKELATSLRQESLVILVSKQDVEEENVIHIPYDKKIPSIPDNTYSHIFVVDEFGEISKDFLSSFIKKAKHDNSVLILCININLTTRDFINNYILSYDLAKIAITGDIFAKDFIYDNSSYVNKFIGQIRHEKQISIPGDGTLQTNPVFFEDAITAILQVGFIENEKEKIFYLYPENKPTLLSLAHMFQKNNPEIKIDFVKDKNKKNKNFDLDIEIAGKYLLDHDYDLPSRVKKINLEKENIAEIKREEYVKKDLNTRQFKVSYLFVGIIVTLIFFFLLPLISTFTFAGLGAFFLQNLKTDIQSQKLSSVKDSSFNAYNSFRLAKTSSTLLEKEAGFIGQERAFFSLSEKINQGIEISYSASTIFQSIEEIKKVISKNSNNQTADFTLAEENLKNALVTYQKEKEVGNITGSIDSKLSDVLNFTSSTIDLWPDLLGFRGKKNYLILFENNMELRPGGGFIGSYASLSLDKGKIMSFKIYDTYDADGQLKSHIEPPFPVRRYLQSPNWYLRDSNFDADFSKGALASVIFLNSEMHQTFDGVIGVDLSFVKNLLLAIGPVQVLDYDKTVTSENLFQTTQEQVEGNFFPGSTQKKDFLNSLFKAIQQKLSSAKNISYLNLLQAFTNSLYEKHIIFAFNNVFLQSVFSINGWGSTLSDNRLNDDISINDFTGISEANFGGNKVNYYITRSVSQNVAIGNDGSINETLKTNFKNSAPISLGAKGIYKNYFRVILPQGANITSIRINEKDQILVNAIIDPTVYEPKKFIAPSGLEVNKENENGKTIYGFLVIVNPEELKTVEVNYILSSKLNPSKAQFNYDLKIFKQPGVDSFPYSFTLTLPKNLDFVNLKKSVNKINNGVVISKQIIKDEELSFILSKQ